MIYFFTVAAPARSGTMWYSRLFNMEHCYCFHELSTLLQPYPANTVLKRWLDARIDDHSFEQTQRRWYLQLYPDYFKRLWERAEFKQHIVGNSDSFISAMLPGLYLLWPDMKFIFSIRNGINCVQSHYIHQANFPEFVVTDMQSKWDSNDFFRLACQMWKRQVEQLRRSQAWLIDHGAQTYETRFEKVIDGLDELHVIWDWIGIGRWDEYEQRNLELIRTPVNARTNKQGVQSPDNIWDGWTSKQRETFTEICEVLMYELGYELPSN